MAQWRTYGRGGDVRVVGTGTARYVRRIALIFSEMEVDMR